MKQQATHFCNFSCFIYISCWFYDFKNIVNGLQTLLAAGYLVSIPNGLIFSENWQEPNVFWKSRFSFIWSIESDVNLRKKSTIYFANIRTLRQQGSDYLEMERVFTQKSYPSEWNIVYRNKWKYRMTTDGLSHSTSSKYREFLSNWQSSHSHINN